MSITSTFKCTDLYCQLFSVFSSCSTAWVSLIQTPLLNREVNKCDGSCAESGLIKARYSWIGLNTSLDRMTLTFMLRSNGKIIYAVVRSWCQWKMWCFSKSISQNVRKLCLWGTEGSAGTIDYCKHFAKRIESNLQPASAPHPISQQRWAERKREEREQQN